MYSISPSPILYESSAANCKDDVLGTSMPMSLLYSHSKSLNTLPEPVQHGNSNYER